ncbi:MAG: polysaccharide deacetylase family protein [Clostridia bacterium]|nr:polysaccharide deacetylase family protein [Clostridia bacterium]
MSDRYLIINADDFGMCNASVLAVSDLFKNEKSALTSSTIMMPCSWAKKACIFAKNNPQYAIGTHLTLTSEWGDYRWAPVNTDNTSSLRDEEGFMWHESVDVEKHADLGELAGEIRAQVELSKKLGLTPSHLDNHMGSLYGIETGRFELLLLTLDICAEYGLPFRLPRYLPPELAGNSTLEIKIDYEALNNAYSQVIAYADAKGVALPDYLIPNEWDGKDFKDYEDFREYIYELYKSFPNGVTETYMHPSLETDELKSITGCWHRRVWEYRILSDPATKQHIEANGIKLINYRDLAAMR